MGKRAVSAVLAWTIWAVGVCLFAQESALHIKYVSTDAVYFDGGRDHGLQLKDTLEVHRDQRLIARLLVTFLADKAASCQVIEKTDPIHTGDLIVRVRPYVLKEKERILPSRNVSESESVASSPKVATRGQPQAISGTISLQFYQWNDKSPNNYDFSQPTARINLKIARISSPHLQFTLRTRGRYDKRRVRYSADVPQKEWRNRIYQCYLDYNDPDALVNAKIGRIITDPLSGIGYIDGLLTQLNLSSGFKTGVLAGTVPEWHYADFQTSIRKYGVYAVYRRGDVQTPSFASTLAFAGEYHGATTSREFIYWQNQYNWLHKLWLYQNLELDYNRGWRKERTGQTLALSSFYFNGQYTIFPWVSAGMNVDSRKNYWTYEYRTISDSLFDELTRRGARAQLNFTLPGRQFIATTFGLRKRESDTQPMYSFTFDYHVLHLLQTNWDVGFYAAGFSSPLNSGFSLDMNLGHTLLNVMYINARYGLTRYQVQQASSHLNHQLQLNGSLNISRYLFINAMYEYDIGDDEDGQRTWVELGSRF